MDKKILKNEFKNKKIDVIVSLSDQTRLWYSKIQSSAGYLFIEEGKNLSTLIIDGRYIEYARKEAKNVKVELLNKDSMQKFITKKQKKYKNIGFESDYITYDQFQMIQKWFPKAKFVPINAQSLRLIKTEEEANLIKKAATIGLKAMNSLLPMIKPGITEKQIEAEFEKKIRELGGEKSSFDMIVASGKRGAMPHGRASSKKIKDGELVTLDFGVLYKGYASDTTRTIVVGKLKNKKLIEIEQILRNAQKLGIAAVRPGITTLEIDKICRDYITEKGYGKEFVHSTGHGLGIDVHELPHVTSNEVHSSTLKEGMVITVEPGIYIEGLGGIRVEDDVLVTKDGHKVLSSYW